MLIDKQNNNGESSSPSHCIIEAQRSNGYSTHETPHRSMDTLKSSKETGYIRNYETTLNRHEFQQRSSPPSPPIRRRVRQQVRDSYLYIFIYLYPDDMKKIITQQTLF